jgi:hypothetical protein
LAVIFEPLFPLFIPHQNKFTVNAEIADTFLAVQLKFSLKLFNLFDVIFPDNKPDKGLNLGFSKHKGHNQVINVFVFEQFPIHRLVQLLQMINLYYPPKVPK